jgi:hypothetical protein
MVRHLGRLYILGGLSRGAPLDDVWASDDDGVTWTQVAATRFSPRFDVCAVSLGGTLYALGGAPPGNDSQQPEVWRSADGVAWSRVALPPRSPFLDAASTPTVRCAVVGDRMYYVGVGFNRMCLAASVSSSDGINWQFEAGVGVTDDSTSPGAAVAGGLIYVDSGAHNSQRLIYRSVPLGAKFSFFAEFSFVAATQGWDRRRPRRESKVSPDEDEGRVSRISDADRSSPAVMRQ